MSAAQQIFVNGAHALLKPVFEPLVTGPLLYILLKGPEQLREPVVNALAKLPFDVSVERATTALKWLFALGVWSRFNAFLNDLALNHWKLFADKKRWAWKKEVAVVTGGSSGIGEIVVKGLLKEGVKVAIIDIQPLPKSIDGNPNALFFQCDITKPAEVKDTADTIRSFLGTPTILVNNAGIGQPHNIVSIDDNYLQKIFGVNIISHFTLVKEFLPDMVKSNKGHIVTVASMASFVAVPGIADYAATKAGALAFHEALNQEIKHKWKAPGVLTTVVHPNWTSTALVRDYEHTIKRAQGPLLKAEDVGQSIVKQIFKCRGAQLVMPEALTRVTGIRGWPNWTQEALRDIVGKTSADTI